MKNIMKIIVLRDKSAFSLRSPKLAAQVTFLVTSGRSSRHKKSSSVFRRL